jgi:hypothetical protein
LTCADPLAGLLAMLNLIGVFLRFLSLERTLIHILSMFSLTVALSDTAVRPAAVAIVGKENRILVLRKEKTKMKLNNLKSMVDLR